MGRPLGALLSSVQALLHGAESDPDVRSELLTGMEGEIHRTQRLLDDLTTLYDRASGPLELDRRPTAMGPWLLQVLGSWREAAQEKGLRWRTAVSDPLPTVDIDPDRLAQALGNLLSNAVKYTPSGGEVTVRAAATDDEAWIEVRDTGIGIPPEEQQRVFAPYYRSPAGRRFPQGMGLGLSIARELVSAHAGTITLESEPSAGSVFVIHLPLKAPPATPPYSSPSP